jgi:hypothetical protein
VAYAGGIAANIGFVPGPTSFTACSTCSPDVATSKIGGGSIFAGAQPSVASANDANGVEVGVQFRSSTPLSIDGIRFFKGALNTGTHVGNLWSSDGTLLASATFNNESAYGWQAVRFSQPVMIAADTTYVASYYAPSGGYAADGGFFSSGPFGSAPLTATAGVFSYGSSSSFPTDTFNSTNYWVDVMYASVVPAGSNTQFTINTTNTGAASGDVTITDPLASGLAWTQDNPQCAIAGDTLICSFGTLTTGTSQVVHLSAPTTPANCGKITNTATASDASAGDTDTVDKSSTADVIVTCPVTTQTVAGHIYDCTGGYPTTTEVLGGTLGATGPQTVTNQPDPLNPTAAVPGVYTMSAGAPAGYQFVTCGGTATIGAPPRSTATESVSVPPGGVGVGTFYVAKLGVTSCQLSIASTFNGTRIPGGDYIWFNSMFKPKGVPSTGATIQLRGASVSFAAGGQSYTVPIPDSAITFSASVTKATLIFNGSEWAEAVPVSFADNVFLSGVPLLVPVSGLPAAISPVTWQGTITSSTLGVSLQWQWAAAVYSQFSTNMNALGVKPLHSTSLDQYSSGDQAGTPENFKPYAVGGARGGGASNATGSYTSTGTCT